MAFGNATKGYVKKHAGGGGGGSATTDYPDLTNKPSINGVELLGNKTSTDLGILSVAHTSYIGNGDKTGQYIDIGNHTLCLIASENHDSNNASVYALFTNTSNVALVVTVTDGNTQRYNVQMDRNENSVKINNGTYSDVSMNRENISYDVYLI